MKPTNLRFKFWELHVYVTQCYQWGDKYSTYYAECPMCVVFIMSTYLKRRSNHSNSTTGPCKSKKKYVVLYLCWSHLYQIYSKDGNSHRVAFHIWNNSSFIIICNWHNPSIQLYIVTFKQTQYSMPWTTLQYTQSVEKHAYRWIYRIW